MISGISTSRLHKLLILAAFFGVITTALVYIGFGVKDHIEQLPIIYRMLDESYLANDFFTNESINSIGRLYYSIFIAFISGSEQNLPLVFLLLTICSNVLISLISYYLAYHLFDHSNLAGIFASALTMSVETFELGKASYIYFNSLSPSAIAVPFILGAICIVIVHKQIVLGLLLCGISSLVHPLLGLELGWITFIVFIVSFLLSEKEDLGNLNKEIIPSLIILSTFSVFLVFPQITQPKIDADLFIQIIAYFRHPHHYLPSTFGGDQYLNGLSFFCAFVIVFYRWRQSNQGPSTLIFLLVSFILILCVGGYLFVEILPSRIWTVAQTFRLLYLIKWLGLVFLGGTIADQITKTKWSYKVICLTGVFMPLILGIAVLIQRSSVWFGKKSMLINKFLETFLIILAGITIIGYFPTYWDLMVLYGCFVLFIYAVITQRSKEKVLFSLIGISMLGMLFSIQSRPPDFLNVYTRQGTMSDNLALGIAKTYLGKGGFNLTNFAHENTTPEAKFLTPPYFGQFRLLAQRAIVVDYKAFPFSDLAMLEWYNRINECYGTPLTSGQPILLELDEYYRNITDNKLNELSDRYGFSYAVLFTETKTDYETIYQNEEYKIIELNPR